MSINVQVGKMNTLTIQRLVAIGAYLDNGAEGILLPLRFLPKEAKAGDKVEVFVYHDSENRVIATTQKPLAEVGEIAWLTCVSTTPQGAFLDMGLMKDLFVPKSQQLQNMIPNGKYIVRLVIDEQTGRIAATEKVDRYLSNENLTVKEADKVRVLVYRRTDLGYVCILNNRHTGLLHHSDIFRSIHVGYNGEGYVRKIYPDTNNIDVALGLMGYERVSGEAGKIIELLKENGGFLPYGDKTDPETIYEVFGMSKKTFKMTIGNLYKSKQIVFEGTGIRLT
jgi:uncharacterized protein